MRLSSVTGDYTSAGSIIDRQQFVAVGGETTFDLTFIDGAEEVYLNGARLLFGAAQDYTRDAAGSTITLTTPLTAGDELLLVGRALANEIPFNKAQGESHTLTDGQTDVVFTSIETDGLEVYVSGPLVDRGRLETPVDYSVISATSIRLTHTFPAGTTLEGVQGGRLAWVDPNSMVVNDGTTTKSLSDRFRDTQESYDFFVQTTGYQLQDLATGLQLQKWRILDETGIPQPNSAGIYPVLRIGKSYWNPTLVGVTDIFTVQSWTVTADELLINALNSSGAARTVQYTRRRVDDGQPNQELDYGIITEAVYDEFDYGGLL